MDTLAQTFQIVIEIGDTKVRVTPNLPDDARLKLGYDLVSDSIDLNNAKAIALNVARIIENHFKPHPDAAKHKAALTILREQAMARAVAIAKQGDDAWSVQRTADALLEAVLR